MASSTKPPTPIKSYKVGRSAGPRSSTMRLMSFLSLRFACEVVFALLFNDRGDVPLRGFEDPVRLYEVRWREE